ncbi:L-methionine gamma-lyase [Luteitalea sp. TBR-22]|uniref:trans-sulfuration enzyme family protein n=1 Tax=Luteitalea sp. TBR-22 TaxID=2802971 RepID=UPI001AF81BD9|nr:aminotransferase class I/II-fold pyridoxal phosphate-dependent enzyme [Luteitalea sp. TBR-22]BCS33062.1 L-methionine gamma-lyase [Luteitalea sp. TBR-22]
MTTPRQGLATRLIHTAEGAQPLAAPLTTPTYETTTFIVDSTADLQAYIEGGTGKYFYSRYENPSLVALEAKLAAAEQGEAAMVFGSGMGAVASTLLGLLSAGDEVICSAAVYGGTFHLLNSFLPRFGVTARFVAMEQLQDPASVMGPKTKLLWFESPINPTLRCVDIARVAAACRTAGLVSVMDNTFGTPYNQQPLTLGVDLVMHSVTKYLNGHSDVTAGAIIGSQALVERLVPSRRLIGAMLDPGAASLVARGLKTLDVRMARHNENALGLARALSGHPGIARVIYPGLPDHPDHAVAVRQMRGFGGMVTIDLAGGFEAAARFFDRVQVFKRATSLGGVESLCGLPVLTSQYGWSDEQLARADVTRGMVRLSVGLESLDDLIADVDQALAI